MIKVLKGVSLVGMLGVAFAAGAQAYLHQVFVLNEGWSDWQTGEVLVQPTLGVYDPALNVYDTVASIEGPDSSPMPFSPMERCTWLQTVSCLSTTLIPLNCLHLLKSRAYANWLNAMA